MSTSAKQALLLAAGGGALIVLVVALARRRLMTTRYALGWMCLGLLVLVAAVVTNVLGRVGPVAGVSPTAVFLAAATIVLVAIALQLSISVSGLQAQIRNLAEDHALLEDRVMELEQAHER